MGWLITFAILFLLAILPLGVSVRYDSAGPVIRILAGPVKLTILPKKEKKPKKKKQAAPEPETEPKPELPRPEPAKEQIPPPREPRRSVAPETEQGTMGGSWTDFLPLVKVALDLLGDFRRKLRLNVLELKLIMAGGDPCNLAISYGRAWAAVGNLMPHLDRLFVIKKRDVEVECDFTASQTLVIARLDITITLGRLTGLLVRYAIRGLKEFLKIRKKRKGGAAT